ncbi:dihydrolipoamide dehydrogenase [Nitrosomonas nitrosa]|uniref:Dihydrolipoyl dehydrogenase n=1 Tax=Nitrosomonas nitrosa TaxID=52442 RepID=A0A1I4TY54_9PROT|nr:dihydrolipoyl dehydrogenase [Nitrosomonas nitrosa]SFM81505.1 dihydrolipoamide dehydrogenase [Nitrosomonas nitrosa]
MTKLIKVEVPDIGDFKDVSVIEVLVEPGDAVEKESPLITLETDKASMEVPSPQAGVIKELHVQVGDKVSQGALIAMLQAAHSTPDKAVDHVSASQDAPPPAPSEKQPASAQRAEMHAEVVVLGAGPGGYTAAFRVADLGKQVVLVERYSTLGGVCLNVGCIPSKALLHIAKVITEAEEIGQQGIVLGKPKIAIDKLRAWKDSVVGKLTKGLATLAKQRKVAVIQGVGHFISSHMIEVRTEQGVKTVSFDHCIIAAGSGAVRIPGFPHDDARMMDSTDALQLIDIPKRMLVIGGGIIGLEMATVYNALGSQISIVEQLDQLMPGADRDVVKPLHKHLLKRYEAIHLNTKVSKIDTEKKGLKVYFEGHDAPEPQTYDRILVAVGRRPNGKVIGAENAGIQVDERGFIPVDQQMRTNIPHIYAIGDIAGEPMLAHKATYEGKLAAEVIAGHKVAFDARTIPSVAYTDPEIAWMGLTETEANKRSIDYEKAVFPWAASGRALAMGRDEGFTKLLFDKHSRKLLGASIVGVQAGDLIAETVLALEMGADMQDIGLTIHPHPTLSETVFFSAEIAEGTITDLLLPKR